MTEFKLEELSVQYNWVKASFKMACFLLKKLKNKNIYPLYPLYPFKNLKTKNMEKEVIQYVFRTMILGMILAYMTGHSWQVMDLRETKGCKRLS